MRCRKRKVSNERLLSEAATSEQGKEGAYEIVKAAPARTASSAVESAKRREACGPEGAAPNPPSHGDPVAVAVDEPVPEPAEEAVSLSQSSQSSELLGSGLGSGTGVAVVLPVGRVVEELDTVGGGGAPVCETWSEVTVVVDAVPETVMTFSVVIVATELTV